MTMKKTREWRVQFELEFIGTRRRRTLRGVEEVPYIFSVMDDGNICMPVIWANTPIRAQELAERRIKENAQKIVYDIAKKTIIGKPNCIHAKGPDGNYRNSKSFYSIKGYRIREILIKFGY